MPVDAQAAAFLPGIGLARRLVAHELDGDDHAALSDLGDVRMILQLAGARRPNMPALARLRVDGSSSAKMSSVASAARQASGLPV